jgi:hypothetical protein
MAPQIGIRAREGRSGFLPNPYLNTYSLDHIFWSQTRMWMAIVMGATMAGIMLGFMISSRRSGRSPR